jgi:hypothetical protein
VRIEFDKPRPVHRAAQGTLFIQLADSLTPADDVQFSYRLVPFGN